MGKRKKPSSPPPLAREKEYSITYTPAAQAELAKVPQPFRTQLWKRVEKLKTNPRSQAKKLEGFDLWRVRQGDYRAVFSIQDDSVRVLIVKVSDRKDVYDRLKDLRW